MACFVFRHAHGWFPPCHPTPLSLGRESSQLSDSSADLVLLLKVLRGCPRPCHRPRPSGASRTDTQARSAARQPPATPTGLAAHCRLAGLAPAAPPRHGRTRRRGAPSAPQVPRGEPVRHDVKVDAQAQSPLAPLRHPVMPTATWAFPALLPLPPAHPRRHHRPRRPAALPPPTVIRALLAGCSFRSRSRHNCRPSQPGAGAPPDPGFTQTSSGCRAQPSPEKAPSRPPARPAAAAHKS